MQWNNTATSLLWSDSLHYYVTSALANAMKTQPLKNANGFCPETRGSLGITCLKHRYQGAAGLLGRKLLQIQLCRFFEIRDRFFNSLALTYRPYFGTVSYIQTFFFVQNSGKCANRHFRAP